MLSGPADYMVVALAAMAAGMVNAIAGGGTLISFPALTAVGIPAVAANVTNTVALCPGFVGGIAAQRQDLAGQARRLWIALPVGAFFGVLGGVILLATGERAFRAVVPYLILLAAGLLAMQDRVRGWLIRRRAERVRPVLAHHIGVPVGIAAVYGGYFGAGLGVILMATLGLALDDTLTRINALKQAISLAVNLAAAIYFAFSGEVIWPAAGVMAVGALTGGSLGGRLAGRLKPSTLRAVVVTVGVIVGVVYLLRQ
jgi:uncharacterized membrane protein YfcA